jgi:hypothetical protein
VAIRRNREWASAGGKRAAGRPCHIKKFAVQQIPIEPKAAVGRSCAEAVAHLHFDRSVAMIGWMRLPPLIFVVFLLGGAGAFAQSRGLDEAVGADGAMTPRLGLTAEQKSAIYNAVLRQRVRASTTGIEPTIGAPVSRSVELAALPGQAGIDAGGIDATMYLKYAMVEDDVVVVDAVRMRVVEIIHGNARP